MEKANSVYAVDPKAWAGLFLKLNPPSPEAVQYTEEEQAKNNIPIDVAEANLVAWWAQSYVPIEHYRNVVAAYKKMVMERDRLKIASDAALHEVRQMIADLQAQLDGAGTEPPEALEVRSQPPGAPSMQIGGATGQYRLFPRGWPVPRNAPSMPLRALLGGDGIFRG